MIAVIAAGLLIPGLGSTAFALSVDFTDGSWNGAHNQTSFTSHPSGIDLYALPIGSRITVNYIGGPSGDNSGMDGLGIGDDEITQGGLERLKVLFSTPVMLNQVYVTDLFTNEGPNTNQPEVGYYSLNGGAFTSFQSVGGINGALTLNIFQPNITSIIFKAASDSWSDYSVKGLNYQTVPEPSSLLLLGVGIVILSLGLFLARSDNLSS